ncbi:MAG: recombinase family protein [Candidatus Thermoplasmatota archaeon]|nr:recombinase family protein [Candidatus Thermoplasmatota archaeon]
MMKVCIYTRVSTENQDLQQQIDACKRFCCFKEFEIGKIYSDVGSGKDFFKRPQFNEMLKALRTMQYQGVVVFRFDRLGRNAIECVKFFEEMESKGIEIFSLNENLDTSTAIGRAIRDIILRLAQLERESISEATKQRLLALKRLGKTLGQTKE